VTCDSGKYFMVESLPRAKIRSRIESLPVACDKDGEIHLTGSLKNVSFKDLRCESFCTNYDATVNAAQAVQKLSERTETVDQFALVEDGVSASCEIAGYQYIDSIEKCGVAARQLNISANNLNYSGYVDESWTGEKYPTTCLYELETHKVYWVNNAIAAGTRFGVNQKCGLPRGGVRAACICEQVNVKIYTSGLLETSSADPNDEFSFSPAALAAGSARAHLLTNLGIRQKKAWSLEEKNSSTPGKRSSSVLKLAVSGRKAATRRKRSSGKVIKKRHKGRHSSKDVPRRSGSSARKASRRSGGRGSDSKGSSSNSRNTPKVKTSIDVGQTALTVTPVETRTYEKYGVFSPGEQMKFACKPGYRLLGSTTAVCQSGEFYFDGDKALAPICAQECRLADELNRHGLKIMGKITSRSLLGARYIKSGIDKYTEIETLKDDSQPRSIFKGGVITVKCRDDCLRQKETWRHGVQVKETAVECTGRDGHNGGLLEPPLATAKCICASIVATAIRFEEGCLKNLYTYVKINVFNEEATQRISEKKLLAEENTEDLVGISFAGLNESKGLPIRLNISKAREDFVHITVCRAIDWNGILKADTKCDVIAQTPWVDKCPECKVQHLISEHKSRNKHRKSKGVKIQLPLVAPGRLSWLHPCGRQAMQATVTLAVKT